MPEQSSGSLRLNEISKPQFYFSIRMAERIFSCVTGCSGSKCIEILWTLLLSAESISSVTYDSYFYVGVRKILFSSHLHMLCFPSAMENPVLCTWVSSASLIDLPAGHEGECPRFSVKSCSETITSELGLCTFNSWLRNMFLDLLSCLLCFAVFCDNTTHSQGFW